MDLSPAVDGLTERERIFVEGILRGLTQIAAAQAAGYANAKNAAHDLAREPKIKAAIAKGREISIQATGVTREKLTDMLMSAYMNAETAAEQIMAVRELGKLHGLYAAQKVEVGHTHELKNPNEKDIRTLSSAELLRLARLKGGDIFEGEFTEIQAPVLITNGSKSAQPA